MPPSVLHFGFLMLPEPGHILPTLRLAAKLRKYGHAVSFFSLDALREFFSSYGFPSVGMLRGIVPEGSADLFNTAAGVLVQRRIADHLRATGLTFAQLLADNLLLLKFDVLLCDAEIVKDCGDSLRQALAKPMISIRTNFPGEGEEAACVPELVLCPREFEIPTQPPVAAANRLFYAEPSVFLGRIQGQEAQIVNARSAPVVYCSFGTQSIRYVDAALRLTNIIDAFREIPSAHLILVEAHNLQSLRRHALPPNVSVLRSTSQLQILAFSRLFITHGGLGSLKESIMAGVPSLVIPFDTDQPRNAQRVEYHKLGRRCPPAECTAERIRELVRTLLDDDDVLESVRRMRKIFWQYEVKAPAGDFIMRSVLSDASGQNSCRMARDLAPSIEKMLPLAIDAEL